MTIMIPRRGLDWEAQRRVVMVWGMSWCGRDVGEGSGGIRLDLLRGGMGGWALGIELSSDSIELNGGYGYVYMHV